MPTESESRENGKQYQTQNPQAEKLTEAQMPNYIDRINFNAGMDDAKKKD